MSCYYTSIKKAIERAFNSVSSVTQHPEDFLIAQKSSAKKFTQTLKTIYDAAKNTEHEAKLSLNTLPELFVKDFDDEQIWQQLELQNDLSILHLVSGVAKLLADKKKISFHSQNKREQERTTNLKTGEKRKPVLKEKHKKEISASTEVNKGEIDLKNSDSDATDSSDEELENIKSRVEKEETDKFFDFTGDSDEDLNFDFGPLSKGGIDDDYTDNDGDDDDGVSGSDTGSGINDFKNRRPQSSKKSVRFKEFENTESNKGPKKQGVSESNKKDRSMGKSKVDKTKNKKGSIVDDAFFKLSDMEAFLEQEDRKEEKRQKQEKIGEASESESDEEEEEDIDMFAELDSGDEDLHYKDFFDPPDIELAIEEKGSVRQKSEKSDLAKEEDDDEEGQDDDEEEDLGENDRQISSALKQRKSLDLLADSESEGEDVADILGGGKNQKSRFEQRQEKLKKKISAMEVEAISEKPWQLSGEITADKRPENSLLQEYVEFEHTSRLPPEITEETTKNLEELILRRIKDKAFDDVERKVKPKDNPFEYKKRITLDQEKSKLSLGEIYEQEYLKQQKKEEEEKSDPDHEEIKKMMKSLFIKLDALSNFHYTPKQAAPEVKIISNQPSISMEEVAPVSVSENKLLAPEEVKEKPKREVKGATEKTKTDKFRERKLKKVTKRERQREKEKRQKLVEKLNPGLGNKYSKEKAMRQLEKESKAGRGVTIVKDDRKQKSGLTSSKAFFTQLQDEVTTHINSKKAEKRKKEGKQLASSKKFKL